MSPSHNFYICRELYRCVRERGAPVVLIVDFGGGVFCGQTSDGRVLVEVVDGCCRWGMKHEIAKQWLDETIDLSSMPEILDHKAYRAIVALDRPAIPLILNELERAPNYWFTALESILIANDEEANPVNESDYGHLRKMTDAWLDWGREQGYLD